MEEKKNGGLYPILDEQSIKEEEEENCIGGILCYFFVNIFAMFMDSNLIMIVFFDNGNNLSIQSSYFNN